MCGRYTNEIPFVCEMSITFFLNCDKVCGMGVHFNGVQLLTILPWVDIKGCNIILGLCLCTLLLVIVSCLQLAGPEVEQARLCFLAKLY